MSSYELKTRSGYDMFEISSMLQKSIRRADVVNAAYAANELAGKFRDYLWKRLLTISAEDCYGIVTKEIIALQQADEFVNKNKKEGTRNPLFVAKAVVLLCMAKKNRDADYVACNFMYSDRNLTDEEYDEYVDYKLAESLRMDGSQSLPGYVFDVHTWKGKRNGKTKIDMLRDEQAALNPHQMNFFDDGDFGQFAEHQRKKGNFTPKEERQYAEFAKGRKRYNGTGGD